MLIKKIDRKVCREIREALDATLQGDDCDLEGVKITVGNARFDANHVTFKVEVALNKNGNVLTKDASAYQQLAESFGLPVLALFKTFERLGEEYEIVGLRPRSANPVLVKKLSNGKTYKMNSHTVADVLLGDSINRNS